MIGVGDRFRRLECAIRTRSSETSWHGGEEGRAMSALHRLKAYFGMVPADELDDYDRYAGHAGEDDEYGYAGHPHRDDAEYDVGYRQRLGGRPSRWTDHDSDYDPGRGSRRDYEDYCDDEPQVPARRTPPRRSWAPETPVHGALAVDPVTQTRAVTAPVDSAPTPEGHPMSRITTLHPRTYNEARTIGEHYRDGIPVIMNLTAMDDADAKRLVDFAAGLAFALRGSIDKVTTKVFLISPANVDVTAEDKRRIAEGSFVPTHSRRA
jgi:cell division inhibitor SepF